VAIIIPDHYGCCVKTFTRQLELAGWCISKFDEVFVLTLGNTIAG
jgi:hypothetical protein